MEELLTTGLKAEELLMLGNWELLLRTGNWESLLVGSWLSEEMLLSAIMPSSSMLTPAPWVGLVSPHAEKTPAMVMAVSVANALMLKFFMMLSSAVGTAVV